MAYRCCDCGGIKASESEIESHINADHIGWRPYQCFYCNQNGITTRKPSKSMLHDHVTERHPDQQFTYLYTDDKKNELLKDMIKRSTIDDPLVKAATSLDVANAENKSLLNSSSGPKMEVAITNGSQRLNDIDIITINEIKPNQSALGTYRCETCDELVSRNLMMIRDHIKIHFKEKTGCSPLDLSKLPHTLQLIYCDLFLTSFPVAGAILKEDIANVVQPRGNHVKKEFENIEISENVHNNDTTLSADSGISHICHKCGKEFTQFTSLTMHKRRWCNKTAKGIADSIVSHCKKESEKVSKPSSLAVRQKRRCKRKRTIVSKIPKETSAIVCVACKKDFKTKRSLRLHRVLKHGTTDGQSYCKKCKIYLGNTIAIHILNVHMNMKTYECSLCKKSVQHSTIERHDLIIHRGLGKAHCIYNVDQYESEIEELRKKLIIKVTGSKLASKHKVYHPSSKLIRKISSDKQRSPMASQKKLITQSKLQHKNDNQPVREDVSYSSNESTQESEDVAECSSPERANETVQSAVTKDKVAAKSFSVSPFQGRTKDGVPVKWHCKECKISMHIQFITHHLLFVHLNKSHYQCSLCN